METFLSRYRNLTVLLVAIVAQMMLLAFQVKSDGEGRLLRVWTVTAVSPIASVLEGGHSAITHWMRDYFLLSGARDENKTLKVELDRLKQETQYLRNELNTAERAQALSLFIKQNPSKMIAARVIGNTTGLGSRVVMIDRGESSGVQKGMAVVTPDGIAGKITNVFPSTSFLMLISDPSFSASVISQKNRATGSAHGQVSTVMKIEHVQAGVPVENGEWFFTSGEDRVFPKGLPVGTAMVTGEAENREITLQASGLGRSLEDVLVILDGVHGELPVSQEVPQPVTLLPPPAVSGSGVAEPVAAGVTDADRLVERYRKIGEATGHGYGVAGNGAPNYNVKLDTPAAPQTAPSASPPVPALAAPRRP